MLGGDFVKKIAETLMVKIGILGSTLMKSLLVALYKIGMDIRFMKLRKLYLKQNPG